MKKNACRAIVTTVLAACLGISLTACVVATETETGLDETTMVAAQPATETVETKPVEPEQIVVPESVISVHPAELARARTLKVGVDHSSAIIAILDKEGNVLDELAGSECSDSDEEYYVCSFRLPAGEYTVEFGSIERYETPESLEVNLKWAGTVVYGSYAEDPAAPAPTRPSLGLPGIGDQLAF